MLLKILLSSLILLIPITSNAISNLEFLRSDSTGKPFTAKVELKLEGESGKYSNQKLNTSAFFSWDEDSGHFMTLIDHTWSSHNGEEEKNKTFFHMRFTKQVRDKSKHNLEFFIQAKQDEYSYLKSRIIGGTGYRLKLFNKNNLRENAFGAGILFELEKGSGLADGLSNENTRLSAYWHHKQPITKSMFIENVIYIQPSVQKLDDFRLHDEIRLTNKINNEMSFGFSAAYTYDSTPILDNSDYEVTYGSFFKYNF